MPLISMFKNATSKHPVKQIRPEGLIESIHDGEWKGRIAQIRQEYRRSTLAGENPKQAVQSMKLALPAVTFSGQFSSRDGGSLEQHSGMICTDLDHLGSELVAAKFKLRSCRFVWAIFLSPTGAGLKVVFRVPADASRHQASFVAANEHITGLIGESYLDMQCKEVNRLCFVSHDDDLYYNPNADELVPKEPIILNDSSELLNTTSCILHPASCILHNNASTVLERVAAFTRGKKTLALRFPKIPNVVALYENLVEMRYVAAQEGRNEVITQAVPFLYRAVAPALVLEFMGCFYDCNQPLFKDSRETHMNQTQRMLQSTAQTYSNSLHVTLRGIYESLPEHERDAFRICRDLAFLTGQKQPLSFFLSFNHLADRIGIFPPQAQRVMQKLEKYGVIRPLKKGTRRTAGVRPEAGTYQWLLESIASSSESENPEIKSKAA